jgi:hypothetical protein
MGVYVERMAWIVPLIVASNNAQRQRDDDRERERLERQRRARLPRPADHDMKPSIPLDEEPRTSPERERRRKANREFLDRFRQN